MKRQKSTNFFEVVLLQTPMTPDVVTSQPAEVATAKNSTKTGKHNERRRRTARFQNDSNRNAEPYWFTARAAAQTVGVQDLATLLLTMVLSSSSQDARNWPSLRGGASHIHSRAEGSAVSTAPFACHRGTSRPDHGGRRRASPARRRGCVTSLRHPERKTNTM